MKKLLIMLFMVTITNLAFAQTKDYLLSSHILDISTGKPAPNVPVKLEMLNSKTGFWDISVELSEKMGNLSKIYVVKNLKKAEVRKIEDTLQATISSRHKNLLSFYRSGI